MKNNFVDIKKFGFYYGMPKHIVRESLEKEGYDVFGDKDFLLIYGRFKEEFTKSIETYTSVKFEAENDCISKIRGI